MKGHNWMLFQLVVTAATVGALLVKTFFCTCG